MHVWVELLLFYYFVAGLNEIHILVLVGNTKFPITHLECSVLVLKVVF